MKRKSGWVPGAIIAGLGAGLINGTLGAAGGMVLLPCLSALAKIPEGALFPMSVCVMLPVCLLTLVLSAQTQPLPWMDALPYLLGGCLGGIAAGLWGKRLPTKWLHRAFGLLMLWGGLRYLC